MNKPAKKIAAEILRICTDEKIVQFQTLWNELKGYITREEINDFTYKVLEKMGIETKDRKDKK